MKGLKLTPFLLFVLLLLVLVFAMLFGSSTNKVMEGLAPGTSNFTAATTATYSDTTMDVVYNDGIQIYYDKSNGNIVIPSTTDGEYTLITRGGTNSNTTSDSYTSGGNVFLNINQVYVVCFNNLTKSVKQWRKNKNGPSYLSVINEHLPD